MYEILGTMISECELMGAVIGAVVGALLTGYALYVVAKVKHDNQVQEAVNDAALAGEEYPSWKIEKAAKWYKGYKLALVELIALSIVAGLAVAVYAMHAGYAAGFIEAGTVGMAGAIVLGYVADIKIIHPIADDKFMEAVEQPLVDAFLHPDKVDDELLQKAKELKKKGLI